MRRVSVVTDTSKSVVLDRELDEEKSRKPSDPHIRCPLCDWSPRKEDKWFCTCGYEWNTFDTRGVCPPCLHQKPVREIVVWSPDVEPHVLRFVDSSPDDSTDQPTAGWCRIDGDMWYCYSEPRLENGKTIHLRFVTKNTPTSANGNSQFSEDNVKWLPLSDDSFAKLR